VIATGCSQQGGVGRERRCIDNVGIPAKRQQFIALALLPEIAPFPAAQIRFECGMRNAECGILNRPVAIEIGQGAAQVAFRQRALREVHVCGIEILLRAEFLLRFGFARFVDAKGGNRSANRHDQEEEQYRSQ
jgi:hypothetical protein